MGMTGGGTNPCRAMACCRAASITFCISLREDNSSVTWMPFRLEPLFCMANRASSSVLWGRERDAITHMTTHSGPMILRWMKLFGNEQFWAEKGIDTDTSYTLRG